ncbi:transposase [Methylobacterium sp. WL12]|nr:transposase [Methylobacterium sp. WL12]
MTESYVSRPSTTCGCNAIERMFGRINDFSCIATRYERLTISYFAIVYLTSTVRYWL